MKTYTDKELIDKFELGFAPESAQTIEIIFQ